MQGADLSQGLENRGQIFGRDAEGIERLHQVARGIGEDQITLTKVPPGALGGTTECGLANGDTPFEVCFSLDNSAAVYVIVYTSDFVQGTLLAQKLRQVDVRLKYTSGALENLRNASAGGQDEQGFGAVLWWCSAPAIRSAKHQRALPAPLPVP